jgi:hypothetical protein
MTRHEQRLCRVHGLDPDVMQDPGWSMASVVGTELQHTRRFALGVASARAYMYAEATKNTRHPDNPMRLYLSGDNAVTRTQGGSPAVILAAHQLGNPWLQHPQQKAETP